MPFQRKYRRRRYTRRNYRKRRGMNSRRNATVSTRAPFPRRMLTKVRYVENVALNPASGSADNYVFSANGLYDPNITGIGHQPRGFDELIALYDHYTVLGSKITIHANSEVDETSTDSPGIMAGIRLQDNTSTTSDTYSLRENSDSKWKHQTSIGDVIKVSKNYSAKKFHGKRDIIGDGDFRGSSSSNPGEQAYYQVWVAGSGGGDPSTIYMSVCIEYIVVFHEPKTLGAS